MEEVLIAPWQLTSSKISNCANNKERYTKLRRVQESLVGVFNQVQAEKQRETISNFSASTWLKSETAYTMKKHTTRVIKLPFSPSWDDWLKSERPKHSIYPHKLDFCAKKKEELRHNQTTLN